MIMMLMMRGGSHHRTKLPFSVLFLLISTLLLLPVFVRLSDGVPIKVGTTDDPAAAVEEVEEMDAKNSTREMVGVVSVQNKDKLRQDEDGGGGGGDGGDLDNVVNIVNGAFGGNLLGIAEGITGFLDEDAQSGVGGILTNVAKPLNQLLITSVQSGQKYFGITNPPSILLASTAATEVVGGGSPMVVPAAAVPPTTTGGIPVLSVPGISQQSLVTLSDSYIIPAQTSEFERIGSTAAPSPPPPPPPTTTTTTLEPDEEDEYDGDNES